MNRTIVVLFVDDEGFWAKPYRERLEDAFGHIHFCDDVDEARDYFAKTLTIDILLLDVMMPTPEGADPQETNSGLDTGLWLLKQMRDELIRRRVPVIMLTNRRRSIVDDGVRALDFPEGLVEVRLKQDTPAFYLPSRVSILVTKWRP